MRHLNIDIETFSDVDIGNCGLYKYAESSSFEILLFAYAWDLGEVKVIDLANGEELPADVRDGLSDESVIKHAYNAAFEITCLNRAGYFTPPEQWRCTQLHGLYLGYPAGLAALGNALGLPDDKRKLSTGKALIKYFCIPCEPTKRNGGRTRNLPQHDPEKWELFKEYNRMDVVTEIEDYKRLQAFPVPEDVQKDWVLDYEINSRGIAIDTDLLRGALNIDATNKEKLRARAVELTGLTNPNSRTQLLRWINENTSAQLDDITKATVAANLGTSDKTLAEILRLRVELGKSSVTKYQAMERAKCSDDRVRGLLQYYGANRTGRWAGRLVQVQNLPRNYIETLDEARALVKQENVLGLEMVYGNVSDTLSQLIRTAFIAPEGSWLCVADFSAIEARVISWLAQEKWRMEVFATTGKIYEAAASMMFNVPVERIKKGNPEYALRSKGKVAELALGYQGGPAALIAMGALDMGLTEDELPEIVKLWRTSNPNICKMWYDVEAAAIDVLMNGGAKTVPNVATFRLEGYAVYGTTYLTVELPSGRKLFYPSPRLSENKFGKLAVHYKTLNANRKWSETSTYGGKLVENITQAFARDCLAFAIRNLIAEGYKPLMHIHDEVVCELPLNELHPDEVDRMSRIMCKPIPWAPGLYLNAAGFDGKYYKKD